MWVANKDLPCQNMDTILNILRTSPPPSAGSQGFGSGLLTNLPREALPLNPIQYLSAIIDSVAPLLKVKQLKGIMGGGASLPIPVPLRPHARRRTAIKWILNSAANRREPRLADRVAKELLAVAEGRGGAWDRRQMVHKLGISARANLKTITSGRRTRIKGNL